MSDEPTKAARLVDHAIPAIIATVVLPLLPYFVDMIAETETAQSVKMMAASFSFAAMLSTRQRSLYWAFMFSGIAWSCLFGLDKASPGTAKVCILIIALGLGSELAWRHVSGDEPFMTAEAITKDKKK